MDYPHLVQPQKIRLASGVAVVPQLGHDAPIRAVSFSPCGTILAALDAKPSLHLWCVEPADVLLIAPVPAVIATELRWVSPTTVAVLEPGAEDDGDIWWVRAVDKADRWRPHSSLDEVLASDSPPSYLARVGRGLALAHADGTKIKLKRSRATSLSAVDPLGRFVALGQDDGIELYDAHSGDLLEKVAPLDGLLTGLGMGPDGAWLAFSSADGVLMRIEPLRDHAPLRLARAREGITCLDVSPDGEYIAIGDESGHLHVYFADDGARAFRTPKLVPGFETELVLAENLGFVGVRRENFGAFLGSSHAIYPMRPLPGTVRAACAGLHFPELTVALEDGRVISVHLADEKISEFGTAPWPLSHLVASEYGAWGVGEGGQWWFDGYDVTVREHPIKDVVCIAVDRSGAHGALAFPEHVELLAPGTETSKTLQLPNITSMAFTQHKGRDVLVLIDDYRVLWRYDPKRGRPTRVGLVELGERGTPWRVTSLIADEDGTLRALALGDNAHRWLVTLDIATGHGEILAGLVLIGHQVIAAYDDEGTWLRPDEDRGIRMVRELRAFEPHDWLRPTEPGA